MMNNPRTLHTKELDLIDLYSNCQLGMTPQKFYTKWQVTYEQIAMICDRSDATVRRWFKKGRYYRRPTANDLRHLALMDFLLEHFDDIPDELMELMCSAHS